ncbi:M15 family metallopeptidase [Guptibacillus algicola]|uniref:M15 family metallopeptidase n=1 Tax=Guptibacillus algicola TaxID=225844 RepID=UPI001CD40FF5|nr:M15 family metallopeptidase [Alkalihalobacillus algicola]MCA0988146.1 M15 family metallopeptidase [Alkalihalobacillus algicola]
MTARNLFIVTGLSLALVAGCSSDEQSAKNQNQAEDKTEQPDESKEENNATYENESATESDQPNEDESSTSEYKNENGQSENQNAYPAMGETVAEENGKKIVTNPDSIYVVANKERNLPADFVPENLVEPDVPFYANEGDPKRLMVEEAAKALEEMFDAANKDGMQLKAVSGYRSYERQEAIFAYNADRYGAEKANRVSAHAGQSEHQTGLTMDISAPSLGGSLSEKFGSTPEGEWVAENAYMYGFVVRYLKGKEEITGYQYEPWHVRYVGKEAAKEIHEAGITLEEFFAK